MADEKGSSFGRGLARLFWKPAQEAWASDEGSGAGNPAVLEFVPDTEHEGPEVDPETGDGAIIGDFSDLYVQAHLQPNPNADALLEAFGGMATMDEGSRRIAMSAMVKGMRADTKAVCGSLTGRITVLQSVVHAQADGTAASKRRRAEDLGGARLETSKRITELEAEIAGLRGGLASAERDTAEKDTAADAAMRGLDVRVRQEVGRLNALTTFFNPSGEE